MEHQEGDLRDETTELQPSEVERRVSDADAEESTHSTDSVAKSRELSVAEKEETDASSPAEVAEHVSEAAVIAPTKLSEEKSHELSIAVKVGTAGELQETELQKNSEERDADAKSTCSTPSADESPEISIAIDFQNVMVDINVNLGDSSVKKRILSGISADAQPGEMMAIMGPTGAGKTTLLNLLSGKDVGEIRGEILMNNRPRTKKMRRFIAYVLQSDLFFTNLTVRETLTFSARLRLPSSMSIADKKHVVDRTIRLLNLDKCADSVVGGFLTFGISGGEKRRLNIGNEILTNPSLLLLDEPTSNLDSSTALSVLRTMKNIVKTGRTVVCTIHQPSFRMLELFDTVLILADGNTVYFGPVQLMAPYFEKIGEACPAHINPADHVMELLTQEQLETSENRVPTIQKLVDAFKQYTRHFGKDRMASLDQWVYSREEKVEEKEEVEEPKPEIVASPSSSPEPEEEVARWGTTFTQQLVALGARAYRQTRGERITMLSLFQYVSISIICALVWFNMGFTEKEIPDRIGHLFFVAVFWGTAPMWNALLAFPTEKGVLNKERASGAYRLSAYFLGKTVAETPVGLFFPFIFTCIVYWSTGLTRTFPHFLGHFAIQILNVLTAESVGLCMSALFMDMKKGMSVSLVFVLSSMLLGGFYVSNDNIPVWIGWVRYTAYLKYSFQALITLDLRGQSFDCLSVNSEYASCLLPTPQSIPGEEVLARNFLDETSMAVNLLVLFGYGLAFRLLAYVWLRRKKPQ